MKKFKPTFEWDNFQQWKCWTYTNLEKGIRYWIFYTCNSSNGNERYNMEIEFWYIWPTLTRRTLIRWISTLDEAMELAEKIHDYKDEISLDWIKILDANQMRWL